VGAVVERHLGAGDRTDPERLQRLRHLHGAVEPVVICQRERAVALLGRDPRQLDRMRRPVKERVGRVAVELDIWHEHMFAYFNPPSRSPTP
jgi:hypothetical protein